MCGTVVVAATLLCLNAAVFLPDTRAGTLVPVDVVPNKTVDVVPNKKARPLRKVDADDPPGWGAGGRVKRPYRGGRGLAGVLAAT